MAFRYARAPQQQPLSSPATSADSQRFLESTHRGFVWPPPQLRSPYLSALHRYIEAMNAWSAHPLRRSAPADNSPAEKEEAEGYRRQALGPIMACFDEGLIHLSLPKSLQRTVLTKRHYSKFLDSFIYCQLDHFQMIIYDVIESGNKMTVHGKMTGVSTHRTNYDLEFMQMIEFTMPPEDQPSVGPLIKYMKEFVDTHVLSQFLDEDRKRRKEVEAVVQDSDRKRREKETRRMSFR